MRPTTEIVCFSCRAIFEKEWARGRGWASEGPVGGGRGVRVPAKTPPVCLLFWPFDTLSGGEGSSPSRGGCGEPGARLEHGNTRAMLSFFFRCATLNFCACSCGLLLVVRIRSTALFVRKSSARGRSSDV